MLEAGRPLDAGTLRDAMTDAFGAIGRRGRLGLEGRLRGQPRPPACCSYNATAGPCAGTAGAGADGPRRMLAMLEAVAALEPSHTRRSEEQVRLQQFSTPLPLAYAALAGSRDPAGRCRAGTLCRHRHAGSDGPVRAGRPGGGCAPSQRVRTHAGAAPHQTLPGGHGHGVQRRGHRRPAARRPADGRADEPAVFGHARCGPHRPRRRPPPCPLGRLDAAAWRPAGDDHVGPLRARRHCRPSGSPGPLRFHHGDRRAGLRPPRHLASTPASPCWSAAPGPTWSWTERHAPPTPAELLDAVIARVPQASADHAHSGSRPAPPATCSASP